MDREGDFRGELEDEDWEDLEAWGAAEADAGDGEGGVSCVGDPRWSRLPLCPPPPRHLLQNNTNHRWADVNIRAANGLSIFTIRRRPPNPLG